MEYHKGICLLEGDHVTIEAGLDVGTGIFLTGQIVCILKGNCVYIVHHGEPRIGFVRYWKKRGKPPLEADWFLKSIHAFTIVEGNPDVVPFPSSGRVHLTVVENDEK